LIEQHKDFADLFGATSWNTTASTVSSTDFNFKDVIAKMDALKAEQKAREEASGIPRIDSIVSTQEAFDKLKACTDHQFNQGAIGAAFVGIPIEIEDVKTGAAAYFKSLQGDNCLCLTLDEGNLQAVVHAAKKNMMVIPECVQYLNAGDW